MLRRGGHFVSSDCTRSSATNQDYTWEAVAISKVTTCLKFIRWLYRVCAVVGATVASNNSLARIRVDDYNIGGIHQMLLNANFALSVIEADVL
jgi:hypothetical protein